MAGACGKEAEAAKWKNAANGLGNLYVNEQGALKLDRDADWPASHRHLSNLMGIYPFNLLTIDGSNSERETIWASLRQWEQFSTEEWVGYTFTWMACMQARTGNPEAALNYLEVYLRAFILRNGFYDNGDRSGTGYSKYDYRPFTLEGNFLAMQAVQEMLLQSWSPTPGVTDSGVIRIFPAIPVRIRDAAFEDLRVEGGHKVSAKRERDATAWFKITAGKDGWIKVRDNFGNPEFSWNIPDVKKAGENYVFYLKKDQSVTATRK